MVTQACVQNLICLCHMSACKGSWSDWWNALALVDRLADDHWRCLCLWFDGKSNSIWSHKICIAILNVGIPRASYLMSLSLSPLACRFDSINFFPSRDASGIMLHATILGLRVSQLESKRSPQWFAFWWEGFTRNLLTWVLWNLLEHQGKWWDDLNICSFIGKWGNFRKKTHSQGKRIQG